MVTVNKKSERHELRAVDISDRFSPNVIQAGLTDRLLGNN